MTNRKHKLSSWQFIALGYLVVILFGSLLLVLPIASKSGGWTNYSDALFTSTSATCVTGLVVYDTYTYWSIFGQLIILMLIQIGGIGFMTIITLFAMMIGKQIGIYERKILVQSTGAMRQSGIMRLIKKIIIGTLLFESLGTILFAIRFCPQMGFGNGIYYAVFHSVSAFCNAGFDLMGFGGEFSSFTMYTGDVIVNITMIMLIFMGGIGFLVWSDVLESRFDIRKFNLHTKVVLIASSVLIVISAILFYLFERNNLFSGYGAGKTILASLFQSVTPRTAGFNTINIAKLSDSSILLTIILMFIGGSSGSTAGGIKVTTFVVILFGILSITKSTQDINIGKKRLEQSLLHQALTIFSAYSFIVVFASLLMCAIEPFSLKEVLFEVVSALGTVGLSTGITHGLSPVSLALIMLIMYTGSC